MPRREYLLKIKEDPEKLKRLRQQQREYRQRLKNDPIRHAKWKESHRKHGKRYYAKNRDKIREKDKIRRKAMTLEAKQKEAERLKRNRIERRRRIVKSWGASCMRCGYSEHPEILEFDHRTPLYRRTNRIKKRVSDHMLPDVVKHPELFELLCPNCHRLKTLGEIKQLYARARQVSTGD